VALSLSAPSFSFTDMKEGDEECFQLAICRADFFQDHRVSQVILVGVLVWYATRTTLYECARAICGLRRLARSRSTQWIGCKMGMKTSAGKLGMGVRVFSARKKRSLFSDYIMGILLSFESWKTISKILKDEISTYGLFFLPKLGHLTLSRF